MLTEKEFVHYKVNGKRIFDLLPVNRCNEKVIIMEISMIMILVFQTFEEFKM